MLGEYRGGWYKKYNSSFLSVSKFLQNVCRKESNGILIMNLYNWDYAVYLKGTLICCSSLIRIFVCVCVWVLSCGKLSTDTTCAYINFRIRERGKNHLFQGVRRAIEIKKLLAHPSFLSLILLLHWKKNWHPKPWGKGMKKPNYLKW